MSAVCYCLFHIFAATLHTGGRSSIRNLRTRHAVVTGTHFARRGYRVWRNINDLYFSPNIIRMTKSRRMTCSTHGEEEDVYRVLVRKTAGKRPLGRPRRKGEIIIR